MAYQDDDRPQRQMYDVSGLGLTCAQCGAAINELPFEPTKRDDGTYGQLFCRECHRSRRNSRPRRDFGRGRY